MCVIIAKTKQGRIPTKETLKRCFTKNSDGAGFMYQDKAQVIIDKGYMNFESFYQRFEELCDKYNNFENKNLVMHMRISTAGGVSKENTHPYPICDDYKSMKMTRNICDIGVAHNGVISIAKPSELQEKNSINDTMVFIKAYLNPIYQEWHKCFENESYTTGINLLTNSRFAVLDKNDNLTLIGDFQEYEDAFYSNTSYKSYTSTYNYTSHYNNYNYDYDYYDEFMDKSYEKSNTKTQTSKEDGSGIFLAVQDTDIFSISDKIPEASIEELRTEDGSQFYYNEAQTTLEEISKDGKTLQIYTSAFQLN